MKQSVKKLQKMVDDFNRDYPVGTEVLVKRDNGTVQPTCVRIAAEVLNDHSAVAWFEGIAGCYMIDRVSPYTRPPLIPCAHQFETPCGKA